MIATDLKLAMNILSLSYTR